MLRQRNLFARFLAAKNSSWLWNKNFSLTASDHFNRTFLFPGNEVSVLIYSADKLMFRFALIQSNKRADCPLQIYH